MQERVQAIAEGPPPSGTRVGGAEGRDGQGRTDSGQKGASATRADCVPSALPAPPCPARAGGTHLPRQQESQKIHSKEGASPQARTQRHQPDLVPAAGRQLSWVISTPPLCDVQRAVKNRNKKPHH